MKNLGYKLSIIYSVIALLPVILYLLLIGLYGYNYRTSIGCYAGDALFIGIKCQGFVGADIANLLVNTPLVIMQLAISIAGPLSILFLMLPVIYAGWCIANKHNKANSSDAINRRG